MKAAGCFLVMVASVGLAASWQMELRMHLRLLYDLRSLLVALSYSANASLQSVEILLSCYIKPKDERLKVICTEMAEALVKKEEESGEAVWKRVFKKYEKELGLSMEEQEIAEGAGEAFFGKWVDENNKHFAMVLERLDFQIETARREQREKQRVYGAVSVLGGLMVMIILV